MQRWEPWIGRLAPDGADAPRCRLRRPQEKKKKPKGRAYKRLQVRRRCAGGGRMLALTLEIAAARFRVACHAPDAAAPPPPRSTTAAS